MLNAKRNERYAGNGLFRFCRVLQNDHPRVLKCNRLWRQVGAYAKRSPVQLWRPTAAWANHTRSFHDVARCARRNLAARRLRNRRECSCKGEQHVHGGAERWAELAGPRLFPHRQRGDIEFTAKFSRTASALSLQPTTRPGARTSSRRRVSATQQQSGCNYASPSAKGSCRAARGW